MEDATIAARALQAGELTSEFEITQTSNWWAKVLILSGIIASIVPQIVDAVKAVPGVETNKTLSTILSICGVVMALAGAIVKVGSTASYNSSRALVKAAAVRDIPITTTVTPPSL